MIVGGYSLHLYCDGDPGCPTRLSSARASGMSTESRAPFEADASSGAKAEKIARRAGWTLRRDGSCLCPACSAKAPRR